MAKHPGGRPSGYSAAKATAICDLIAQGHSLRQIEATGLASRFCILEWLGKHEEFAAQYAHARELQAEHFADEILEISDDGSNDWMERENADGSKYTIADHEHISRSKLRVDARKWLMARMAPKKYGDKVTQEVTGKDGGPQEHVHKIERVIVRPKNTDG